MLFKFDFIKISIFLDSLFINFHQVHDSIFQMIVFEISHTDEIFFLHLQMYAKSIIIDDDKFVIL
jgi:hypothetical protein